MRGRALVGFQARLQRAGLPRDRRLPMVYRLLAGERGDPVVKGELARDRDLANVEAALQDPDFKQRDPLLLGLGLAPSAAHEKWLDAWIRSGSPPLRAAAAEALRFRGAAPPVRALAHLQGIHPPASARAARATRAA